MLLKFNPLSLEADFMGWRLDLTKDFESVSRGIVDEYGRILSVIGFDRKENRDIELYRKRYEYDISDEESQKPSLSKVVGEFTDLAASDLLPEDLSMILSDDIDKISLFGDKKILLKKVHKEYDANGNIIEKVVSCHPDTLVEYKSVQITAPDKKVIYDKFISSDTMNIYVKNDNIEIIYYRSSREPQYRLITLNYLSGADTIRTEKYHIVNLSATEGAVGITRNDNHHDQQHRLVSEIFYTSRRVKLEKEDWYAFLENARKIETAFHPEVDFLQTLISEDMLPSIVYNYEYIDIPISDNVTMKKITRIVDGETRFHEYKYEDSDMIVEISNGLLGEFRVHFANVNNQSIENLLDICQWAEQHENFSTFVIKFNNSKVSHPLINGVYKIKRSSSVVLILNNEDGEEERIAMCLDKCGDGTINWCVNWVFIDKNHQLIQLKTRRINTKDILAISTDLEVLELKLFEKYGVSTEQWERLSKYFGLV